MIQRNLPSPDPSNPATLRAARIESRATPLSAIKSEHNARHRTKSQDRAQLAAALQAGEPVVRFTLSALGELVVDRRPAIQLDSRDWQDV